MSEDVPASSVPSFVMPNALPSPESTHVPLPILVEGLLVSDAIFSTIGAANLPCTSTTKLGSWLGCSWKNAVTSETSVTGSKPTIDFAMPRGPSTSLIT